MGEVTHMIAVDTKQWLALQDELVALREERSAHAVTLATQRKVSELEAENERLRKALQQYADHQNWYGSSSDYECHHTWDDEWQGTDGDGWEIAEQALKGAHDGA